jgi:hypothetical protein
MLTVVAMMVVVTGGAHPIQAAVQTVGQIQPYEVLASSDDRVTVLFRPEARERAETLLLYFTEAAPLPGLPSDLPRRAEIVLAPSETLFEEAVGGRVPEWGAAVAIPSEFRIVLPGFGSSRGPWNDPRTLRHEWAHLGLHGYLRGLRVPRWFSEGYAEWASGGWSWSEGWRLRLLLAREGNRLDSLDLRWPRSRTQAEAAYLLSASAVEYLATGTSERALEIFLSRWRETENFEAAFRSTFGQSSGKFEGNWKKFVKRRYGWLFVLSHSAVFWAVLSVASVLMWRTRRGRRRLQMAGLRAREIPELPAYWLPPPGEGGMGLADGKGVARPPA